MISGWMLIKALHVLAGAFWFGAATMIAGFLLPAARLTGPAAGPFMGNLMGAAKLPLYMNVASWTTILMGLPLYWRFTSGFTVWNFYWPGGIGLLFGSVAGICALLWGTFVQAPNAKRLNSLLAQAKAGPTPELGQQIQVMQRKLYMGAWTGVALILVSLVGMTLLH